MSPPRYTPSPTTTQTHPSITTPVAHHVPELCDVLKSLTAQPGQRVLHQRPVASASSVGGSAQSLWAGAGDHGGCGGSGGGGGMAGGDGGADGGMASHTTPASSL